MNPNRISQLIGTDEMPLEAVADVLVGMAVEHDLDASAILEHVHKTAMFAVGVALQAENDPAVRTIVESACAAADLSLLSALSGAAQAKYMRIFTSHVDLGRAVIRKARGMGLCLELN